jgi:rare lipoprotein A
MANIRRNTIMVGAAALAFGAVAAIGDAHETRGIASYYGGRFDGRRTASGCTFHANRRSAASRVLPLGTWIRVTNMRNGRTVIVPITDRGPYIAGRIIDLSQAAARAIGAIQAGVVPVAIEVLPRPPSLPCVPS